MSQQSDHSGRSDAASQRLAQLREAGVSIWLDDLSRERLVTGTLAELIRDKHVVGVTTNPSIFQKAVTGSAIYDEQVRDLARRGVDIGEALRAITTYDVRWGCDVLRPAYDASDGVDGRVSIEVDPRIAHDSDRTVAEAKALWWLVDRPNLYIKIPATEAGLPAITGKLELEYEGELKGADSVARDVIRKAAGQVYARRYATLDTRNLEKWFEDGNVFRFPQVGAARNAMQAAREVPGLYDLASEIAGSSDDAMRVAAAEFVLEGLYGRKKLSRAEETYTAPEPEVRRGGKWN